MTIPKDTIDSTYLSLDTFLKVYANIENGYKYEWNDGRVEKTKSMNQEQSLIQKILTRLFYTTRTSKEDGSFVAETDMKTGEKQLKRPDLAIYFGSQQKGLANGENQIAPWIGEIISSSDNINYVNAKVDEYFAAGVKVVWHIFPASKQVYVYTASDQVKICRGTEICSGKPAIEDFEISANDLFAYQEQYSKKDSE